MEMGRMQNIVPGQMEPHWVPEADRPSGPLAVCSRAREPAACSYPGLSCVVGLGGVDQDCKVGVLGGGPELVLTL